MNDAETFKYQCDIAYEDHQAGVEAGEESGDCTDCCDKVKHRFI